MKLASLAIAALAFSGLSGIRAAGTYTNFIRQVQLPSGVVWDASVLASGEQVSALPIDVGGARFELWTVLSAPLTSYLLDTRFVSAYAPTAEVVFRSEDPYAVIPRTRADRPFSVEISVNGLLSGAGDPEASKSVKLLRHVQSYGTEGNGDNIDRTQATLLSQAVLAKNGKQTLAYSLTSIPSANLAKVRGEERFSVYTLADGTSPESQIASRYVQVWPVADGTISGIAPNQKIRLKLPQITLTLNDLYPDSKTYAQVYRGAQKLGTTGTIVPGTSLVLNGSVPESRTLVLDRYDSVFDSDGVWTMELLTITPFGTDRLAYVTFEIDRTLELNGTFTTME